MKKIDIRFLSQLGIILLAGYILSFVTLQIDLTQENRFTIHPVTEETLAKLPEGVLIKIYLEGDMPIGFKRLRNHIEFIVEEFRMLSDKKIDYQFIDPLESESPKERNSILNDLYERGLQPTNVKMKDDKGNLSEKLLIPGAILNFGDKEIAVNLLTRNVGMSAEVNLNYSIETIEYTLINALKGVTTDSIINIAIIEGHDELNDYETADITRELEMSLRYRVFRGSITNDANCLKPYQLIIIAKPRKPFLDEEKFIIDQYLMNGGKILWLIDQTRIDLDSLQYGNSIALLNTTNIDDLLFRYGVRINPNLLQDVQCSTVPINISLSGEQAKFVPAPFLYLPLLTPSQNHSISRNMNIVLGEFTNTIDTVGNNQNISKHVLLSSSIYSRTVNAPVMVSLEEVKKTMSRNDFNAPQRIIALLIEGEFESHYKNRMVDPKIKNSSVVKPKSKNTAMVVVADGDIIKNGYKQTPQGIKIMPLGTDKYSNQTYGNKDFILNVINYLTDNDRLFELRSREVKLRLLDKTKLKNSKLWWQILNVVMPPVLILLAGIMYFFIRRKRFTRPLK